MFLKYDIISKVHNKYGSLDGKEDADEKVISVGSFVLPVLRDCLC